MSNYQVFIWQDQRALDVSPGHREGRAKYIKRGAFSLSVFIRSYGLVYYYYHFSPMPTFYNVLSCVEELLFESRLYLHTILGDLAFGPRVEQAGRKRSTKRALLFHLRYLGVRVSYCFSYFTRLLARRGCSAYGWVLSSSSFDSSFSFFKFETVLHRQSVG